jgi:hypothetical protein
MPTAITVFADSVFFLILYLGFRNIVSDCHIRTLCKIGRYRDGYELRHHDEHGTEVSGWTILFHAFNCEAWLKDRFEED